MDPDVVYLVSMLKLSKMKMMDNGGIILILDAVLQAGEEPDGPPTKVSLGLHRLQAAPLGQALLDATESMSEEEDPTDVAMVSIDDDTTEIQET